MITSSQLENEHSLAHSTLDFNVAQQEIGISYERQAVLAVVMLTEEHQAFAGQHTGKPFAFQRIDEAILQRAQLHGVCGQSLEL